MVAKSKNKKKSKSKTKSFLKTGKEANKELKTVQAEYEARKEQMDKPFRFSLHKDGEEGKVTFLDGDLDSDGLLQKVCFYEHHVKLAGRWGNFFVCPGEFEPCPICEEGEYQKEFVVVFTVLDHRKYVGKDDKVYQHQRKLFVCKSGTLEQLQKIASKKDGLVGVTLELTRTGSKKARVGDLIMYEKTQDLKKVAKKLGAEEVLPLDYDECFPSYTGKELEDFGFILSSVGSEMEVEDDIDDDDFDFDDDKESKKKKGKKGKKAKVEDDDDLSDDMEVEDEEDDDDDSDELEF